MGRQLLGSLNKLKGWRYILLSLVVAIAISGLHGCSWFVSRPIPVESLSNPTLPSWIKEISPLNEANPLNQIRVIFQEPIVSLERLDNSEQGEILSKFEIQPPLEGQFRLLTPRMVGFQPYNALPIGSRFRVTLKQGLQDFKQNRLNQDRSWTFNTPQLSFDRLPKDDLENLQPQIKFNSNAEVNLGSLQANTTLVTNGAKSIPFEIKLDNPEAKKNAAEKFDPSRYIWQYTLTPKETLAKATKYKLAIAPGVLAENGNLATNKDFSSEFSTYKPFTFIKLDKFGEPDSSGTYGRFENGGGELKFNNPLSNFSAAEQIENFFTIEPKSKEKIPPFRVFENVVRVNPYALEPATNYKITVKKELKDKFGQTLEKDISLDYNTGNVSADLQAPTGLHIFPTFQNLQLNLSTINLPESNYRASFRELQPTDLVYIDPEIPNSSLPKPEAWQSFPAKTILNQVQGQSISLGDRLQAKTGMLVYGIKGKTFKYKEENKEKWREPEFFGAVQLTNLGVFAQWFPQSGMVRVHRLQDGKSQANVEVQVYLSKLEQDSKLPKPDPVACATGITNAEGVAIFNRENLRGCMDGMDFFLDSPNLLTIAKLDRDWAFTRTLSYSNTYDYGITNSDWENGTIKSRGTIFSDRSLYQPGEDVWLTGLTTYLQGGELKLDRNVSYAASIRDPSGKITQLGSFITNNYGTFSLKLNLAKERPLGSYRISAKGETGVEISGDFRVAQFKPPNFKVDLNLTNENNQVIEFAKPEQKIQIKPISSYLFGAPVQSGKVKYNVNVSKAEFVPQGWQEFNFGQQWFYPEEAPRIESGVLELSGILDNQGQATQEFTVLKEVSFPLTYRVDAEVSDVSNLAVATSKEFTVLPSDRLIGLQQEFVADAGQPFKVRVIVTDVNGKATPGENVKLELQKMKYSSVTQIIEGSSNQKTQVEYIKVAETQIRSETEAQTINLTATEAGSYRIRAILENNPKTITDSQIWVSGTNAVTWSGDRYNRNRLILKLDKENYKVGEIAKVLVQSPYPEAELHFAVVRDRFLFQSTQQVKGSAPQFQFKVTAEMLPNAAVEVVMVRQGEPLERAKIAEINSLSRIGLAPFSVNLAQQYLKVETQPLISSLAPGAEQTLSFKLKNAQNQPQPGQITVMVVNEAILQLTKYRAPDLVKTVYANRSISTRFSDNRPDVVLESLPSYLDKGWGYGGSSETGAGNTRIRKNFSPIAYYNGAIATDSQGNAQVKFKLPDDLTTWRIMAVAMDGKLHFGNNSDNTFISTKPLLANPLLPQFVRPGDVLEIGLAVSNNQNQTGNLNISGNLKGGLYFLDKSRREKKFQAQLASGTNAYRFPVEIGNVPNSEVTIDFGIQSDKFQDAFSYTLPIKPFQVTEQVIETGRIREENAKSINVKVDEYISPHSAKLEVTIANTLIPEVIAIAALDDVLKDKDLRFLETSASQLALAANLKLLSQSQNLKLPKFAANLKLLSQSQNLKLPKFNLEQIAAHAIENIQSLQRANGGFARYPSQTNSDPYVTPYAARAIAQAIAAKFPVPATLLPRAKAYLQKILANPNFESETKVLNPNQVRLDILLGDFHKQSYQWLMILG
jgi:alpha-2-macroglobulin